MKTVAIFGASGKLGRHALPVLARRVNDGVVKPPKYLPPMFRDLNGLAIAFALGEPVTARDDPSQGGGGVGGGEEEQQRRHGAVHAVAEPELPSEPHGGPAGLEGVVALAEQVHQPPVVVSGKRILHLGPEAESLPEVGLVAGGHDPGESTSDLRPVPRPGARASSERPPLALCPHAPNRSI